jgi:SAM-dependent methyltransferase
MHEIMRKFLRFIAEKVSTIKPVYYIASVLLYTANRIKHKRAVHRLELRTPAGMLGADWIRLPMYDSIYQFFLELAKEENITDKVAVEVGGSEGTMKKILESFGVRYTIAPDFPNVDILHLPYEDNSLDFIILDQVLEHVERPWIAVNEIYRVLRASGISVVTAPFLLPYHASTPWKDYYRYTQDAWRLLFCEFEVLTTGGWGNIEAIHYIIDNSVIDGPMGQAISLDEAMERNLLVVNDEKCPIVTWCIARKPLLTQETTTD